MSCFNVSYKSNKVGARDDSFDNNKDNDIILIGDSFAEGYGVDLENTSQRYIEKLTNRNVLNFGVAKNFGPVQYSILYDEMAKKFKHKTLIIYLLPDNDFEDNDYTYWNDSKRFRPYYKSSNKTIYETFIPKDAIKNYMSETKKVKSFFKNYFWTSNMLSNINYNYKLYISKKTSSINFSGYFDSSLEQQKAVIYFLDKMINSSTANVILVSIPRINDLKRLSKGSKVSDLYWNNYYTNMDTSNNNFKFIDLIKHMPDNPEEIYLKCEGHWNAYGNKWVAKIISKYLDKY